jgi:hypothetical protein
LTKSIEPKRAKEGVPMDPSADLRIFLRIFFLTLPWVKGLVGYQVDYQVDFSADLANLKPCYGQQLEQEGTQPHTDSGWDKRSQLKRSIQLHSGDQSNEKKLE